MKTMKKNIVLKLLTGVVTTTITATGIAVPMMVGSEQNREDISVIVDEDIQVAETVVDTKIIGDEPHIVEDEAVAEYEAIVEDDAEAEDMAEVKDDIEVEENESTDTESAKAESAKAESAKTESAQLTSTPGQPVQSTSTPGQAAQSTSTPEQPVQPTREPTHTHSWKEHTATKQVWVPNIVVVDDYETSVVGHVDDVFICDCGYTTTSEDDIEDHIVSNVLANNSGHGGFGIQPGHSIIEQVKVGSHEEDKGHYETQTYVDYYYCDCGATK